MTWPTATDCLAGTIYGTVPGMVSAAQDMAYYASRCAYFDRIHANAKDGSVLFFR